MNISIQHSGAVTIAVVTGRLDTISYISFEEQIFPLAKTSGVKLLLDFSDLEYISSAGLRSIMILLKELQAASGKLAIYGLKEMTAEIFRISGFITLVKVFDQKEDAVAYLA